MMEDRLITALADFFDRRLPTEGLRGKPTKNFWVRVMVEAALDAEVQAALDEEVRLSLESVREGLLTGMAYRASKCASGPGCHEEESRAINDYFDSVKFGG